MDSASAWWTSLPISWVVTSLARGRLPRAMSAVRWPALENFVRRRASMARGVLLETGGVAQDHGGGEDGAERVGLACAGDVGGGAVDGLVEIDCAADGGRGQHAERAGDDAGLVGEDVAEEVFGEHDVEVARDVHEVHRHGVDELVLERDVGVVLCDFGDGGAPELRDLEHVGLVDGGDFLAALLGELEGDAGDADDLVAGVAHGVDGLVRSPCSTQRGAPK